MIMDEDCDKLAYCSGIKAVLMLLVILYHSCVFWTGEWFTCNPADSSFILAGLAKWLDSFHIYGFTLVSGYLYAYVYYERGGYSTYRKFILKKAKRLLVPYATIAIVWVIPIQTYLQQFTFEEIFNNYFLGCSPNQLWFLLMLFGVFVIFYPFTNYFRNLHSVYIVIVLYVCGFILARYIGNYYMISRALMYIMPFWIGFQLRLGKFNFVWRIPSVVYIMLDIGLFILTTILLEKEIFELKIIGLVLEIIVHVIGAIMSFVVISRILERTKLQNKAISKKLMAYSMPMYLFHQQIICVIIRNCNGRFSPTIIAAFSFAIAVFGSYIISWCFKKHNLTKVLIGG